MSHVLGGARDTHFILELEQGQRGVALFVLAAAIATWTRHVAGGDSGAHGRSAGRRQN